jgi:hypothetical protein
LRSGPGRGPLCGLPSRPRSEEYEMRVEAVVSRMPSLKQLDR